MAVVMRDVPGSAGLRDAVSAYGYPGATTTPGWSPPDAIDWSDAGIVSLFARERLSGPPLAAGASERGRVLLHDPAQPRRMRPRLAEQIRAAERQGYAVQTAGGPESGAGERAGFHAAYTQTMRVTGAAERYFFEPAYFDKALSFAGSWLVTARSAEGEIAAGAIVVRSDGHLHYFLGGTADAAREDSPFKNVVAAMLDLADAEGMPLNLGGGLAPGDGLERFKRGFANSEAAFTTQEIVCDSESYARLAPDGGPGGFFPPTAPDGRPRLYLGVALQRESLKEEGESSMPGEWAASWRVDAPRGPPATSLVPH